ncbi:MAG: hypothetical protein ACREFA_14165 [Stellaceae bacterium]
MRTTAEIETENRETRERIARLESQIGRIRSGQEADERDELAAAQARADAVAALFGERVPSPGLGQGALAYRRSLLRRFQKHSPQFKDSSLGGLDAPAVELVERQVYADAADAARAAPDGKPGVLVPQQSRDAAGRLITRFYGDPLAWMQPFIRGGQVCHIREKLISGSVG